MDFIDGMLDLVYKAVTLPINIMKKERVKISRIEISDSGRVSTDVVKLKNGATREKV